MNKLFSVLIDSIGIEQLDRDQLNRLPIPFHNKDIFDNPEPFLFTLNSQEQNDNMRFHLLKTHPIFNLIIPIFEVYENGFNRWHFNTVMTNFKNIIYLEKWMMEQIIENIFIDHKIILDEDLQPFFQRQFKIIDELLQTYNKYEIDHDELIEFWMHEIYTRLIDFRMKTKIFSSTFLIQELEQKIDQFLTVKSKRMQGSISIKRSSRGSQNSIKNSTFKGIKNKQSVSSNQQAGISTLTINGLQLYKLSEWEIFHDVKQNALLQSEIHSHHFDEEDKLITILQDRRKFFFVNNSLEFHKLSNTKLYDKNDRKEFLLKLYGKFIFQILTGQNPHFESLVLKTMRNQQISNQRLKNDTIPRESVVLFRNLKYKNSPSNTYREEYLRKPEKWQIIREIYKLSVFWRKYFSSQNNFANNLTRDVISTKMLIHDEFHFTQLFLNEIKIIRKDNSLSRFQ